MHNDVFLCNAEGHVITLLQIVFITFADLIISRFNPNFQPLVPVLQAQNILM